MNLYRDPLDKRVFVPTRNGRVLLNFGHPIAWAIVVSTTIIPLVVVVGITIAVLA
ncbi:hypothetical protein [Actinoplanes friuliensis]|uniref:Uncharacterized protein n=1 Tax=Actinoplanes friuliensis DSM 7358 TaxID=1246995 RepID=U5VWX2_9ACTN|nr:hypothetical protein [Actinoplanes friuliensis]AGZ40136.1 hypothetical protein AFR_09235 [Actinoplanes friuliensis DSM 7358]